MARESSAAFTVPESVLTRLNSTVQGKRMRNLAFTTELQEIIESFETRGVRAVPFKGPVLSAATYDDATVREYNDLDLLVHPEDITVAADILEERGYEWRGGTPRLDDAALLGGPVTKAIVHEYEMRGPEFDVELRWRVGDAERPFSTSFGELWDRRDTVSVGGQPLPALAQPDRLLVLAFHGTKHRWYLLKWLCDFVAALESTEADWSHVLARARETGVQRNLLLGAALARTVFGYALPAPILDRLRTDDRVTELTEAVVESLAAGTPQHPRSSRPLSFTWLPAIRQLRWCRSCCCIRRFTRLTRSTSFARSPVRCIRCTTSSGRSDSSSKCHSGSDSGPKSHLTKRPERRVARFVPATIRCIWG